jgi:hypothetical protein
LIGDETENWSTGLSHKGFVFSHSVYINANPRAMTHLGGTMKSRTQEESNTKDFHI